MVNNDHTKEYSAADIQRYLQGNMSAADMHALEQAALDDPFLADAIEGMQQTLETHDAGLINTHLSDLSRQVAERTKQEDRKTRVIAFRWWQVVAAAAIVVVAGLGIYRYAGTSTSAEKNLTDEQIAQVKPAPQADKAVAATQHTPEAKEENKEILANATEKSAWADTAKAIASTAPANTERSKAKTAISAPAGITKYKSEQANIVTEKNAGNDDIAIVQAAPEKQATYNFKKTDSVVVVGYGTKKSPQPLTAARQQADYEQIVIAKTKRDSLAQGYYTKPRADLAMDPSKKELFELSDRQLNKELKKNPNALLSGFIKGRVADQNNIPLYNAVVRVGDNKDFLTDKQGYFKIPANDSVVKVAVGYNGYYTQNLQLQNNTRDYRITLNQLGVKPPNPQLNGLLVKMDTVGYIVNADTRAKSSTAFNKDYTDAGVTNMIAQIAQPEYGWLEYHQYLDKNKKITTDNTLTGKVVVSFQVDKKGLLSNFKIVQSLGKEYDEEAIRLIKAGPSWKLTKGRKARAVVVVNF